MQSQKVVLKGKQGYFPNQALFDGGTPDEDGFLNARTVLAGENAIHEEAGWRAFGDALDLSETRSDSALAYTATLVNGSANVTLSAGANALTTLRVRQHFLLDGELFLVFSIMTMNILLSILRPIEMLLWPQSSLSRSSIRCTSSARHRPLEIVPITPTRFLP